MSEPKPNADTEEVEDEIIDSIAHVHEEDSSNLPMNDDEEGEVERTGLSQHSNTIGSTSADTSCGGNDEIANAHRDDCQEVPAGSLYQQNGAPEHQRQSKACELVNDKSFAKTQQQQQVMPIQRAGTIYHGDDIQPLPSPVAHLESREPGAYHVCALMGPMQMQTSSLQSIQTLEDNDSTAASVAAAGEATIQVLGAFLVNEQDPSLTHHPDDVETVSSRAFTEQPAMSEQLDTTELVEARIITKKPKVHHCKCISIIVLLVLIGGLMIFWVVSATSKDSQEDDSAPAGYDDLEGVLKDVDSSNYPPFQEDLPLTIQKYIADVNHSHHRANQWVLDDPNYLSYTSEKRLQRFHMVSFYFETRGDDWYQNDNWLSYAVDECDWFQKPYPGFPICDDDGVLWTLSVPSNNLQGQFPLVEIFIESLRVYDVGFNNIEGKPPALAHMPYLEVLIVSHNRFEGQLISAGVFSSFGLKVVKLDGNNLFGNLGPMFFVVPELQVLNITGNLFSGEIPDELSFCRNLTYAGLGHNSFSGTVPEKLASLEYLQELDISGNPSVEGVIPSDCGAMTNLIYFDVSATGVTGTFPDVFCEQVRDGKLEIVADCQEMECCDA